MKKVFSYIISHLRVVYLLALLAVTVALILIMFPNEYGRVKYDYTIGSFWRGDDLYAPYDFSVLKSDDQTNVERQHIMDESPIYFAYDTMAAREASLRLATTQMSHADMAVARQLTALAYSSTGYCRFDTILGTMERHPLIVLSGNVGTQIDADKIVTPERLETLVNQAVSDSARAARITRKLIDSVLVESLVIDDIRTHLELDTRLSQLGRSSRVVERDELIVAKGQRVDEDIALVLQSLEKEESQRITAEFNSTLHYLGQALLCVIAFVALYIFLKNIRHPMLGDLKKVTFAFFIIIFISAIVALIVRFDSSLVLMAPVCMVPILMRIFFDQRVALYIHIVTVIIIGNLVPNSYEFIFYQLVSGMMSIITVRNFERRSNFFAVALVIFFTYSLIYIAGTLSTDTSLSGLQPDRFLIFFFNALLTLLSYPLIFLFEHMFGMTTNLTLMEISSTNTPALRDLSQKAPGTFQHSMQVANIAEDIINEIGGNSLLAKVGALYHDIGKIAAPLYFTENQNNGFNPHDNLEYEESARIITQHVRDGIDMAKKYKLPSEVCDFIRTHHGTTVTGYFYAQAKLHRPNDEIQVRDFRYPGPEPFSRETAVVMIVDSTEAACKSLKSHDKESIDRMVDKIIDDKIENKQLDNCALTLRDINEIRSRLKDKMTSIYHVRIAYPTKK